MRKICFRIGESKDSLRCAIILYNTLIKNNYGTVFICEGQYVKEELKKKNIICESIDDYRNDIISEKERNKILNFIQENEIFDFNYFIHTQKSFYPNNEPEHEKIENTAFAFLLRIREIFEKGFTADYFFDFAGNEIPHTVFEFLCKLVKGRKISYRESVYPDRLGFIVNNEGVWKFKKCEKKLIQNKEETEFINNFIQEYFEGKKVFWGDPKLSDYKVGILNKKRIINKIFVIDRYINLKNSIIRAYTKKIANLVYDDISVLQNKDYFYFPLHYPLDSNIIYRGKPFMNQIPFIEMLLPYLPYGFYLIVKEHPHARGAMKLSDLKRLKKDKRIILLHPWVNSHDIVQNAKGVLAINSTVAIEALYHGVPVVSFGRNYLRGHELVNEINGFYELENVFNYKNYKIPRKDALMNFLVNAYRNSEPICASKILSGKATDKEYITFAEKIVTFLEKIRENN